MYEKLNLIILLFIFIFYRTYLFKYRSEVLAIIISCPSIGDTLNLNILEIPFTVKVVKCDKKKNLYNAREAGLMLDFIIKNYYNSDYERYLFIHDHDISSHYQYSITKRLNKIVNQNFIYSTQLIGVNCHYYDIYYWNKSSSYKRILKVDKFLTEKKVDHINFSDIMANRYSFPCCASFFMKKELIFLHTLQYYKTLKQSLVEFILSDNNTNNIKIRNYLAGAYMEFTWTSMFGQKNVKLPSDCSCSSLK